MSEDKELVEVWQSEFESLMAETFSHRSLEKENGHYIDRDVFYWFAGFLMAKRSQPSVVLESPSLIACDRNDDWDNLKYKEIFQDSFVAGAEYVISALTAAGIKYTVKG